MQSRQQNFGMKLVIWESFPPSSVFHNCSDLFFKQSLSSEITARIWQLGVLFPFLVQPQVRIILVACTCSCFNSQKMGVTAFMRKNHCYRQTSIYDFFSFNLWYAYESNFIYTALLKFPSSHDKNTGVNAAFHEQMLSLSKGSRFDTQLCLVENDIVYRWYYFQSKVQYTSVINSWGCSFVCYFCNCNYYTGWHVFFNVLGVDNLLQRTINIILLTTLFLYVGKGQDSSLLWTLSSITFMSYPQVFP